MKRNICLLLAAVMMLCNLLAMPVGAEETAPTEASAPTAPPETQPPETTVPDQVQEETEAPEVENTLPTESETTTPPDSCSHAFGDWDADEGSHWKICAQCGYRESSSHAWAAELITVQPTCKDVGGKAKVCTVCQGVLVVEIIPQLTTHTFDHACDDTCNVCGISREVTHTFGKGWSKNYKGHWHVCSVCGAEGEVKEHYAGPAATEQKDQICLTCGYILTRKLGHTHKWDTQWSNDEGEHWYTCSGCNEKRSNEEHIYTGSCDPDCDICGYKRQAEHNYEDWQFDEVSHWQTCTRCGHETIHEKHMDGTERCSVCQMQTEIVHVHEYAPDWNFDKEQHWKECECGQQEETEIHSWDEGREEKNLLVFQCTVCQAEKLEEIPASGFPWWILILTVAVLVVSIAVLAFALTGRRKGNYVR